MPCLFYKTPCMTKNHSCENMHSGLSRKSINTWRRAILRGDKTYMKNHSSPLLIATNNAGKIKELQDLLQDTGIELVTPSQIGLDLDVIEDGSTYAENATKKAVAFAQASGLISLADDSGLEVDALNGAPGLYSARYGSPLALPPFSSSQKMGRAGGGLLSDKGRRL